MNLNIKVVIYTKVQQNMPSKANHPSVTNANEFPNVCFAPTLKAPSYPKSVNAMQAVIRTSSPVHS